MSRRRVTVDKISLTSFYNNLLLGFSKSLSKIPGSYPPHVSSRKPCESTAIESWEKAYSVNLPEDFKEFYLASNGFNLEWKSIQNGVDAQKTGDIIFNSLEKLSVFNVIHSYPYGKMAMRSGIRKLKLGLDSKIFILTTLVDKSKVMLVFINSKVAPTIWLHRPSQDWHFLAEDFKSYFILNIAYLGFMLWQLQYVKDLEVWPFLGKLCPLAVPHLFPFEEYFLEETKQENENSLHVNYDGIPMNTVDSNVLQLDMKTTKPLTLKDLHSNSSETDNVVDFIPKARQNTPRCTNILKRNYDKPWQINMKKMPFEISSHTCRLTQQFTKFSPYNANINNKPLSKRSLINLKKSFPTHPSKEEGEEIIKIMKRLLKIHLNNIKEKAINARLVTKKRDPKKFLDSYKNFSDFKFIKDYIPKEPQVINPFKRTLLLVKLPKRPIQLSSLKSPLEDFTIPNLPPFVKSENKRKLHLKREIVNKLLIYRYSCSQNHSLARCIINNIARYRKSDRNKKKIDEKKTTKPTKEEIEQEKYKEEKIKLRNKVREGIRKAKERFAVINNIRQNRNYLNQVHCSATSISKGKNPKHTIKKEPTTQDFLNYVPEKSSSKNMKCLKTHMNPKISLDRVVVETPAPTSYLPKSVCSSIMRNRKKVSTECKKENLEHLFKAYEKPKENIATKIYSNVNKTFNTKKINKSYEMTNPESLIMPEHISSLCNQRDSSYQKVKTSMKQASGDKKSKSNLFIRKNHKNFTNIPIDLQCKTSRTNTFRIPNNFNRSGLTRLEANIHENLIKKLNLVLSRMPEHKLHSETSPAQIYSRNPSTETLFSSSASSHPSMVLSDINIPSSGPNKKSIQKEYNFPRPVVVLNINNKNTKRQRVQKHKIEKKLIVVEIPKTGIE